MFMKPLRLSSFLLNVLDVVEKPTFPNYYLLEFPCYATFASIYYLGRLVSRWSITGTNNLFQLFTLEWFGSNSTVFESRHLNLRTNIRCAGNGHNDGLLQVQLDLE